MKMRRRNVRVNDDETEEIKKGPWKVEEDQVLINHVKKYGPRDWSSIRSKGLLQRTGKSCRLRWVNKLRPNLKTGVKFLAEEERTVIELQERFGNKWAKIATYLSGRTDNDVKNFWSSRQKRLKRILHTSTPSSSKSHKSAKEVQFHEVAFVEAHKFSSSTEEESTTKSQPCSTSYINNSETIRLMPLPEQCYPTFPNYEQSQIPLKFDIPEKEQFVDPQSHVPFVYPQTQPDFLPPLLGDANYLDVFGNSSGLGLGNTQFPIMPSISTHGPLFQDTIIDDFPPIDMFDRIEPLPSPSEWS